MQVLALSIHAGMHKIFIKNYVYEGNFHYPLLVPLHRKKVLKKNAQIKEAPPCRVVSTS
jgi:hypothetical protein